MISSHIVRKVEGFLYTQFKMDGRMMDGDLYTAFPAENATRASMEALGTLVL